MSCLSQRKQNRRNYNYDTEDIIEGKRTFSVEEKLASPKFAEGDFVKMFTGDGGSSKNFANKNCCYNLACLLVYSIIVEFTLKYIQENGFNSPIVMRSTDGLDIRYVSSIFCANYPTVNVNYPFASVCHEGLPFSLPNSLIIRPSSALFFSLYGN